MTNSAFTPTSPPCNIHEFENPRNEPKCPISGVRKCYWKILNWNMWKTRKVSLGLVLWSNGYDSTLPMQRVRVWSGLISLITDQGTRSHMPQLRGYMLQLKIPDASRKIEDPHVATKTQCSQINRCFLKKKDEVKKCFLEDLLIVP